jgi:hypothetical protein
MKEKSKEKEKERKKNIFFHFYYLKRDKNTISIVEEKKTRAKKDVRFLLTNIYDNLKEKKNEMDYPFHFAFIESNIFWRAIIYHPARKNVE